jgi:hypothetical protein
VDGRRFVKCVAASMDASPIHPNFQVGAGLHVQHVTHMYVHIRCIYIYCAYIYALYIYMRIIYNIIIYIYVHYIYIINIVM